ncbi:BgTH12-01687 [Blumeria graminis f. sp. triticale]|uniref:BgTH12-01687 n=1 Tax=Blumeria graminis f. sp. triticale TaxID=1689686 RepID=A0A9W4D506_BLUGR|nr:BgTH12-01687 [Blumeria graminis f. sp. triticale]
MASHIPIIATDRVSEKASKTLDIVKKFVEERCIPADPIFEAQVGQGINRWNHYPNIIDDLKVEARKLGLWNMFLPKSLYQESPGFTNLEYALMAEWLGRSRVASEAVNCAAPDSGNMEVLALHGSSAQKKQWLQPLLNGEIRSAFLMTEPHIASSDAKNIQMRMTRVGNEYTLNGEKWWSSGVGDPRCKIYIVMAKSDEAIEDPYKQHSVILVPSNTRGISIKRMMSVYGYDDAPHGHGHLVFNNVKVPSSNLILGSGRGFEIVQSRLGPGRIHHAMRCIGAAERAIEWMLYRINDPRKIAFGKQLSEHGVVLDLLAKSRVEIDAARLVVLNAAIMIDKFGSKKALKEIGEAKILVPSMTLTVIDRAIQSFGAAGVSQDTPLASLWAQIRTLRIADGPDEVHLNQLGRNENKKGSEATRKITLQGEESKKLFVQYGMSATETYLKSNL